MIEYHERGYVNGYLERKAGGKYEGTLTIEGVDISPIAGVYFKENGKNYLWLKRKPLLEWEYDQQQYIQRPREPRWEAYLQKQSDGVVAYRGEFAFLRFKFSIVGVWDNVFCKDRNRLNLFVERLPMKDQTIINGINERNKEMFNKKNNKSNEER